MTAATRDDAQPVGTRRGPGLLWGAEFVVGFDDSPTAHAAVRWAAAEAGRFGCPLTVINVAEPLPLPPVESRMSLPTPDLREASAGVAGRGVVAALDIHAELATRAVGVVGGAAGEIVARSSDAGLVVVGRRRRNSLQAAVLGSVSFAVAMHARCPVVVVQDGAEQHPDSGHPVLVGVDGSRPALASLALATQFALAWQAPLHVIGAWQPTQVEPWSDAFVDPAAAVATERAALRSVEDVVAAAVAQVGDLAPDLKVEGRVVEGPAADVLVEASRSAGVVVVGSRGRGGFAGLMMGSVSHSVLRQAHSPVAVVRRGSV